MSLDQVLQQAPNAKFVGLYFSASYCKWYSTFTPQLESIYPQLLKDDIEIILVGSDKTEDAYNEYSKSHPWSKLEYENEIRKKLREIYEIKTIPALVFLDREGNVVNAEGRNLVVECIKEDASVVDKLTGPTIDYDSENEDFQISADFFFDSIPMAVSSVKFSTRFDRLRHFNVDIMLLFGAFDK